VPIEDLLREVAREVHVGVVLERHGDPDSDPGPELNLLGSSGVDEHDPVAIGDAEVLDEQTIPFGKP